MAKSNNPLMHGVRGALGKQIVFRIVNGKQFISSYPDMRNVTATAKQKKQRARMRMVHEIIADIKSDPVKRDAAQLRLNVPSNKLHHALIKEQMLKLSSQG